MKSKKQIKQRIESLSALFVNIQLISHEYSDTTQLLIQAIKNNIQLLEWVIDDEE